MPGFLITGSEKGDGPASQLETARSHRWEVEVIGMGRAVSDEIKFHAHSVSRPSIEFDKMVIHHRQNELNLPGKYRCGTMNLTLYERVTPGGVNGAAFAVRAWWAVWLSYAKLHSLNFPDNIKKIMRVVQLDGNGDQIWGYKCAGVFPTKVEGSTLDYTSSDLSTIAVTLSIDAFQEGEGV